MKRLAPHVLASLAALTAAGVGCRATPPPLTSGPGAAPPPVPTASSAGPLETKMTLADVGLDEAALDRKADPCNDFYQYACGGWEAKTEIPGDEPAWYRSFSEIDRRNEALLRKVLDGAAEKGGNDPVLGKLAAFYGGCLDEAAVEAAGLSPVEPLLAKARKVSSADNVGALVGELHKQRVFALFDLTAAQDPKDAKRRIVTLDQNGLGLPDRDYYTKEDDDSKKLRALYTTVIGKVLELAGEKPEAAIKQAELVLALETELAKAQKTKEERRDPNGMYNKIDRAGLEKKAARFPWGAYFKALGVEKKKDVNVTSVGYFEALSKLLPGAGSKHKAETWRAYLAWHVMLRTGQHLTKPVVSELFRLESALTGVSEQKPRWKRCVEATDGALGELLAQPFVKEAFPGESKQSAERMVFRIRDAFVDSVKGLDWMDAKTKERALAKLGQMAYLIGYPKRFRVYDFAIDKKTHGKNVLAARVFETTRDLARLDKPLDREEWQMTPPMVNAYYDPQQNHMVFPAGILQPPFYSVKSHTPVNLGGIGMVIGHELTHGFDDEGAKYDGDGNLRDWWEPEVGKLFGQKTSCVEKQYEAYEPLPGLKLKGKLTLGENIADLGGVKLAFMAYRAMRKGAAEVLVADGFTEDQQFFLAHAQAWCAKYREPAMRRLVATNPHSPPRYRVNGPLVSSPEFASAFSCKAGSAMAPASRCSVW